MANPFRMFRTAPLRARRHAKAKARAQNRYAQLLTRPHFAALSPEIAAEMRRTLGDPEVIYERLVAERGLDADL